MRCVLFCLHAAYSHGSGRHTCCSGDSRKDRFGLETRQISLLLHTGINSILQKEQPWEYGNWVRNRHGYRCVIKTAAFPHFPFDNSHSSICPASELFFSCIIFQQWPRPHRALPWEVLLPRRSCAPVWQWSIWHTYDFGGFKFPFAEETDMSTRKEIVSWLGQWWEELQRVYRRQSEIILRGTRTEMGAGESE